MLPALVETRAVLSKEKHRRTAALTLRARRRAFRSRETAPDLEAAVDRAVHALRRQVRETKARRPRRPPPGHRDRARRRRADPLRHHHRALGGGQELCDQVFRGSGVLLRRQPPHHADPDVRGAVRPVEPGHPEDRARGRRPRRGVSRAPDGRARRAADTGSSTGGALPRSGRRDAGAAVPRDAPSAPPRRRRQRRRRGPGGAALPRTPARGSRSHHRHDRAHGAPAEGSPHRVLWRPGDAGRPHGVPGLVRLQARDSLRRRPRLRRAVPAQSALRGGSPAAGWSRPRRRGVRDVVRGEPGATLAAANSLSIAKDGVLINKGSTQTQRNLTVTAAIISELYNQMSAEKKLLYKYSNTLMDYQNQLDSLSSDSSLFHFPSDSANIIQYAKRLSVVYKEISPVDSSLRSALANMQDLQLKVDLMAFGLQSVMEEIDIYRSNLSTRVVQREVPIIWQPVAYSRPMKEIIKFSIAKEKMELGFYIRGNKGRIFLLFVLPFVLFLFIRSLKKMMHKQSLLNPDFTGQLVLKYPLLSSVFIGFTLFQFVFLKPPFIFSFCVWSISLVCLAIILHRVLTDYWMKFWYIFIGFFFLASADNFLLQVSRMERWFMLALAGTGFLFLIYILITDRRKELKERGVSYFIPIVVLMEALSFIFNLFGRFNISKSLLVTGFTGIVVAILFLWTARLINEILGISYRMHDLPDRRMSYFNFEKVGKKVPPVFYVLLVIGWFILMGRNFYIFKEIVNPTENFFTEIRKIGEFNFSISDIFVFLFILALSLILSKVISFFATAPAVSQGLSKTDRIGVGSWLLLTRIFILSLGILLAFAATGIPVDKLTIILGALSVGIGLGLQGMVSNLVSGLIIAFEKPVNVGDMLEVNGKIATLKSIGFRSCILRLTDGTHVVIPNSNLLNQNLVNWSMGSFRKRTSIKLGLAYGTDIEKTRGSLQNNARTNRTDIKKSGAGCSGKKLWSLFNRI